MGIGEIAPIYLGRRFDEDNDPLGFIQVNCHRGLGNEEQEKALASLAESFRFKDAQQVYGKSAQPTSDFLNKAIKLGRLEQLAGKKGYRKIIIPGGVD